MSTASHTSRVASLQREIDKLNRDLARIAKDIASKSQRIIQIERSITKSTSQAMLRNKQSEISRLHRQIADLQKKKADLNHRIATKTSALFDAQQKLSSARSKEQEKALEAIRRKDEQARQTLVQQLAQIRQDAHVPQIVSPDAQSPEYDVFISHAYEDKEGFVRPLAQALKDMGLSVWYDEFELKIGDSLRRSIDKGLANSRFGIVVLSPSFFEKNWTQYELDGLVSKEMLGGKVILPIWHKLSKDELIKYSPSLADKVALNSAISTVEELANDLIQVIRPP